MTPIEEFAKAKDQSIDLLCKMREMSTLVDILNNLSNQLDSLNAIGVDEYEYCKIEGKKEAITEMHELINNKIKNLRNGTTGTN